MLRGFYTAASGILQQERTLGVLTNNIVNANTPGFRASRVVSTTFEHEFMTRLEKYNSEGIGGTAPIRVVSEVPVKFDASSLEQTGRAYDLAINGEGFFIIERQDDEMGRYLTRNGSFDVDEEGYLTLRGAGRVIGENGAIYLPNYNFVVDQDGTIYEGDTMYPIDRIRVVVPTEDQALRLTRDGLYTAENIDAFPEGEANTEVIQGWTERSNVDVTQEYTMVMEAQRAFQACSSALQIIDRLNQKAATQIASL